MQQHKITRILTFDSGFDRFPESNTFVDESSPPMLRMLSLAKINGREDNSPRPQTAICSIDYGFFGTAPGLNRSDKSNAFAA